jgi:putative membrane protein
MKLHPLSILYQILAGRGWKVMNFILSILLIAPFLFAPGRENGSITGLLIGAGIIVGIYVSYVTWEVLYYQFFRYDIRDEHIHISSGVFFRREREIPLHRIQNVDVNRGFIQRLLGLSELRLESAGGNETEVVLECVSRQRGEELRDQLRRIRSNQERTVEEDIDQDVTDETPSLEFKLSGESYFLLCVLSLNRGVLSWFVFTIPVLMVIALQQLPGAFPGGGIILFLMATFFALIALLSAWGIAAVTTFARYYDFTLLKFDDALRFQRGLIARRSGSIPLDKIQKLIIRENVFMRMFGFASLEVETAGYGPGESTAREAVIPLARRDYVLKLARRIESFPELQFQRPPKRTQYRYAWRYACMVVLLTIACFASFELTGIRSHPSVIVQNLWLLPMTLLPGSPLGAYFTWYHIGYQVMNDHCVMRYGFWNRTTMLVPFYRVQTTISSQSIFQKFWDLRTLTVDTAGSYGLVRENATAFDIDANAARALERDIRSRFRISLAKHRKKSLEQKTRERSDSGKQSDS